MKSIEKWGRLDRKWLASRPAGAYLKCHWDFKQAFVLDEIQEAIKARLILLSKNTNSKAGYKEIWRWTSLIAMTSLIDPDFPLAQ